MIRSGLRLPVRNRQPTWIRRSFRHTGTKDQTSLHSHAAWRRAKWWETEQSKFALWVSSVTEDELREGHYPRQTEALAMARRLHFLPMLGEVRDFAENLLRRHVVPESKPRDALQMAISAAHGMDYLLTWNYAHLANPIAQRQLEMVCRRAGLQAPLLVSPRKRSQGCLWSSNQETVIWHFRMKTSKRFGLPANPWSASTGDSLVGFATFSSVIGNGRFRGGESARPEGNRGWKIARPTPLGHVRELPDGLCARPAADRARR